MESEGLLGDFRLGELLWWPKPENFEKSILNQGSENGRILMSNLNSRARICYAPCYWLNRDHVVLQNELR